MKKILITAPVHQSKNIFKEYLWSLNRLLIPEDYEIHKYFYLHNCENLKKFLQKDEYEIIKDNTNILQNETTHSWTKDNFNSVAQMRDKALNKAREENYDYIFSVDSDVILHKNTLNELIEDDCDIVAKMYWTVFDSKYPWYNMPNGYDEFGENNERIFKKGMDSLKIMGLHEIGVTGACTLIGKRVIKDPIINYKPISIVSTSRLEDYAFCFRTRCAIQDAKIYIDNVHMAKHLYREEDYLKWINGEKQLWEKEC